MASSYDREGGNYDWANYQRVEGDEGVILDVTAPGMIVRAWSAHAKGTLRIYLDGEREPVVDEDFQTFLERMPMRWGIGRPVNDREELIKLTLQKNQPLGRTTYCVIPFKRGCKVTLTPAPARGPSCYSLSYNDKDREIARSNNSVSSNHPINDDWWEYLSRRISPEFPLPESLL